MAVVFKKLASMEKGRTFVDRIKIRFPLIGKFILLSDIARFARTLALLIDAGISIDRALDLSADTLSNSLLRDEIKILKKKTVYEGASVSSGLKKSEYFPPLVSNMTAVGEEGGRMDESLLEVADFYDKEIDTLSKMATSLLEPILILVVGLIVGFIVASMLLPIFQLGTSL
jgi:type IV pilus assembly protein PilC